MPAADINKDEIFTLLRDAMISGLEKEMLTEDEMQKSASYILFHLDAVKTNKELVLFLRDLSTSWSAYMPVYVFAKQKDVVAVDTVKLANIQSKIQQLIQN